MPKLRPSRVGGMAALPPNLRVPAAPPASEVHFRCEELDTKAGKRYPRTMTKADWYSNLTAAASKKDFSKSYDERRDEGIRSVFCPACKVGEGEACKAPSGKPAKGFHSRRVEFASACNRVPIV